MNELDTNDTLPTPDELAVLKARADMLGLTYHPSIGLEKLREKVNAAVTSITPVAGTTAGDSPATAPAPESTPAVAPVAAAEPQGVPANTVPEVESDAARRYRKKREANELIRVRITCMNPAKAAWDGEIFTAGNSLVGSFKKYVPFNADEGWHVPRIILNQIQQRQCQIFIAKKDSRGNSVRVAKLIKEFGVEVMDALSQAELKDLAQRQALSKAID